MKKEKRHVGRPTNEELEKRKNKKIITVLFGMILFFAVIIMVFGDGSLLKKLKGACTHYTYKKNEVSLDFSNYSVNNKCYFNNVEFKNIGNKVKKIEIINKENGSNTNAYVDNTYKSWNGGLLRLEKNKKNSIRVLTYDSKFGSDVLSIKNYEFNVDKDCKVRSKKLVKTEYTDFVYKETSTKPISKAKKGLKSVLKGKSILFYGTSIGKGVSAGGQPFIKIFADKYEMKLTNRAKSGESAVNYYFGKLQKLEKKDLKNYDFIVIEGFANDAEDLSVSRNKFKEELKITLSYLNKVKKSNAKVIIYLTPYLEYYSNTKKQRQYDIIEISINVAKTKGAYVCNDYGIKVNYPKKADHPDYESHKLMAESFETCLSKILNK